MMKAVEDQARRLTMRPQAVRGEASYDRALQLARKNGKEYRKVVADLKRSIKAGNAEAAYALGNLYYYGKVGYVPVDLNEAVRLFRLAAERGNRDAMYFLGYCHELGHGVRKNQRRAYQYYLMAAIRGDVDSMDDVARMLYWGIGTHKDRMAYAAWRQRASELVQS